MKTEIAVEYKWEPEGNGLSLYKWIDGQRVGPSRGNLNTDATGSTARLGFLYNAAPSLVAACEAALAYLQNRHGHVNSDDSCAGCAVCQNLRTALAAAKGTK